MILIDTREGYKEEIQEKLTKLNVQTQIMKLEDYTDFFLTSDNEEVENTIAIQRKTIAEVLSKEPSKQGYKSMMDEIRDRIVNETKAKYEDTWLLVEDGGLRVSVDAKIMLNRGKLLYETGISIKSYYNFLHSLEDKAISIKTVPSLEFSVWWLYSIHAYIQKHHYPKPSRKYNQLEELVGALMGIQGVGEKKALQIVDACAGIAPKAELCALMLSEMKQKPSPNTNLPIDVKESISDDVVKSVDEKEEDETENTLSAEEYYELEKEIDEEFGPTEEDELLDEV